MISGYSINYPALAAIGILCLVGVYHWIMSRKQEFEIVTLPSTLVLAQGENGVSIHHESDVSINGVLHFEQLVCRNLYIGPMACLEGRLIQAEKIVVRGEIKHADHIIAKVSLENFNYVEATRLDAPEVTLGKKSVSVIQIVPKETLIHRKKGSQSRGFFSSPDELHTQKSKQGIASIRLLRRTSH